jgi:hypothetical protein
MSEDKYRSWPIYKLQSECKRWGIVPFGDKSEMTRRLVALEAYSDGPVHPTPNLQTIAEDPTIYLSKDYFELQEICYERKLPTAGAKCVLMARLMDNDKRLWLKVNKKVHTDATDPDREKRTAYHMALMEYTDLQMAVMDQAQGKHDDGKVQSAPWRKMAERCKAANTGLEKGEDPVLGHDRGLEVLSKDRSWPKATQVG